MESKGRRASRQAGQVEASTEPSKAVEIPIVAAEPAVTSNEPRNSAEIVAETPDPAETPGHREISVAVAEPPRSLSATVEAEGPSPGDTVDFGREVLAALTQSQAALARGLDALSAELAGLALSGMDSAARAASKMLGIKTLSDAIEVNTGFTCSSLDALIGGSARLSELGVKLAAETSEPLFNQFGRGWIKPAQLRSARS